MVDIVIPVYNRKHLVKRAIRSVCNQTFKNWKIKLVDDGSQDGLAADIKQEFQHIYPRQLEIIQTGRNRGVSYARNLGIKQGSQPLVAFLDSDDEWLAEKLEKQTRFLNLQTQLPLVHCDEMWMYKGKPKPQKNKHKKEGGYLFDRSCQLCLISPSAVLIRRSTLNQLGLFQEDMPVCEDYEMWLRVTSRFPVGFLQEVLVIKHGGHEGQLSQSRTCMDYWRVRALYPYLNKPDLSLESRSVVKKVLKKKCEILLKGYNKHKNFKDMEEVRAYLLKAEQ